MNLTEWRAVLATESVTANQLGAILGQFERLGYGEADRAERLAMAAALLGLDELGSTRDLTMGEAGRLLRMLQDCPDRASLPTAARAGDEPGDQAGDGERGPTLAQAIAVALALLIGAWQDWPGSADAGPEVRGD